uniref:Uncharacterized protein n=1 Tax=viral metagenome TaxID=1070528 RepID=A0A6C0C1Z2_9ZZZZ
MAENDKILISFLNKCGIVFEEFDMINGLLVPRYIFTSEEKYNSIRNEIKEIKQIFSSSSLTSLQTSAVKTQKWPLLNLVRQILKVKNYNMKPIRKSAGYTDTGKKKYDRFFQIEKIKQIKPLKINLHNLN